MTYAHIFKTYTATGFKFVLYITSTPNLQCAPMEKSYYLSKATAKSYAAAKGAKAWNY